MDIEQTCKVADEKLISLKTDKLNTRKREREGDVYLISCKSADQDVNFHLPLEILLHYQSQRVNLNEIIDFS